ncbi:Mif2/CENP-C like-domain-containing protein [Desarmillaria tabescens]|uniref:Mif2/CENP-C like-domain-containing protein n=1 Tax=Armillaria tabescens TaxID=1929756 RepID=A0AA39NDB5_ARMTA|nr:Mif2/CENP-C like-domain-containing protein [Desarmillaria tabescens]KAK0463561.1 Mif2/CENP-C like-domain-containing protein [Desarmillaria tabescens]
MPSTPRRSSVGTSRRDKPHVPYRGDNPDVGKKTGVTVKRVTARGDGFEPFEQLLQQADQRTPPAKRSKRRRDSEPEEDIVDEDGEQDMELDDSPIHYIANSRKPATPSSSRRIGSSSRPVARVSDVDFDEVPSPRPQSSRSNGRGRSRLSETVTARDLEDEEPEQYEDQDGGAMNNGDYDDLDKDDMPSPQQTSFMEMDRDDDDEQQGDADDVPPVVTSPNKSKKGKQRVTLEEPEEDVEAGIAHELEQLDREVLSDDDEEPSQKKVRVEKAKAKKALSTSSRRLKENRSITPEGVRRSQRRPCKPLQWWRLEKRVYGRVTEGRILVPEVKEIRRLAPEPVEPLGAKKRKRSTRSKSKAPAEYADPNPEKGWDDETNTHCEVLGYPDGQPRMRRIACTARMVHVQQAANSNWFFEKIFVAKQSKRSKDNTYIFYIIEGAINLRIHETSMILCAGAMFMVPRGNAYFIENIAERDAKLFFSQAREDTSSELSRPVSAGGRSSSAGARAGEPPNVENPVPKRAASSKI